MYYSDGRPIIACSSGNDSNTAISVIRLSGFKQLVDLQSSFTKNLKKIKPKLATLSDLVEDNVVLDNVLLLYFEGPNSYNGENILELHVHGNQLNVNRIINHFKTFYKFTEAKAGEFTYRALQNNKLSLSQVEGLDLFLNANSDFMLNQGYSTLFGELQSEYIRIHEKFLKLKASVELSIDFLEDVGQEAAKANFQSALKDFENVLIPLAKQCLHYDSRLLDPTIALVGRPNAGKSTLFNKMVGYDRVIVNERAGTTRDLVSETILSNGVKFRLVDTAGLRDSDDVIEAEGIRRSK